MADSLPKVLYLTHRVPYPPDKGDRIRTFHLLRCLSSRASVHLACLADEPTCSTVRDALAPYCARIAIIPHTGALRWLRALGSLARGRTATEGAFHSPALVEKIRDWAEETPFDMSLVSSSSMVPYLRTPELQDVPAVVDLIDVDSQKWLDYAATSRGPQAWLYRAEGRRLRRLEQALPSWTRAVTLVSGAEVEIYQRFCAPGTVCCISNGVDLDYFQPSHAEENRSCVFVGALDYRPNVEGISWFCREVWPALRREQPEVTLKLVGRRPTTAIHRLAEADGVEIVGQVPDVRPYLAAAAVVIAPLQMARGVQNKVLEAMAMGKPVVCSPQALQGIEAEPGTHLFQATAITEWQDVLSRLLASRPMRTRVGAAGRAYVEQHHCWERRLEPFLGFLEPTSNGREAPPLATFPRLLTGLSSSAANERELLKEA